VRASSNPYPTDSPHHTDARKPDLGGYPKIATSHRRLISGASVRPASAAKNCTLRDKPRSGCARRNRYEVSAICYKLRASVRSLGGFSKMPIRHDRDRTDGAEILSDRRRDPSRSREKAIVEAPVMETGKVRPRPLLVTPTGRSHENRHRQRGCAPDLCHQPIHGDKTVRRAASESRAGAIRRLGQDWAALRSGAGPPAAASSRASSPRQARTSATATPTSAFGAPPPRAQIKTLETTHAQYGKFDTFRQVTLLLGNYFANRPC